MDRQTPYRKIRSRCVPQWTEDVLLETGKECEKRNLPLKRRNLPIDQRRDCAKNWTKISERMKSDLPKITLVVKTGRTEGASHRQAGELCGLAGGGMYSF